MKGRYGHASQPDLGQRAKVMANVPRPMCDLKVIPPINEYMKGTIGHASQSGIY